MLKERYTCFKRRLFILGSIKALFVSGLIGRLFYLQGSQKQHFDALSRKNQYHTFYFSATRGSIFDCNKVCIAFNKTNYSVFLNIENKEFLIQDLQKVKEVLSDANISFKKQKRPYVLIKTGVSFVQMAELQLKLPQIPRLFFEINKKRCYARPELFCHVIGYVRPPNKKDIQKNPELTQTQDAVVGRTGLEQTYDNYIRGRSGFKHIEVNASQHALRVFNVESAIPGQNLLTTLNSDLQEAVYKILEPYERAVAIVMDPYSGAIFASVSYPGYDANLFNQPLSQKTWSELNLKEEKPFLNRTVQGVYSPASSFKMVVLLHALHYNLISPTFKVNCNGHFEIGSNTFHCWSWKHKGHGSVDIKKAVAQSCNVFFYYLATKISVSKLLKTAGEFGFGELTGIDISNEKRGLLPSPEWKKKRFQKNWTIGDTLNFCIGQGYFLTTPIQVAKMMCVLINGGKNIVPHYVKNDRVPRLIQNYDPNIINLIKEGMNAVVNEPYGTAYAARTGSHDFLMGGKSGSSQVSGITRKQRAFKTVNERAYHLREHAFFVGYAPIKEPRYAVFVLIEHGVSGGRVAAPVAREILLSAKRIMG